MHYLHKILVYIPDAIPDQTGMSRDDLLNAIRTHASDETEGFYGTVYDWRETESAGRWTQQYPINVLLAEEGTERFLKELSEVKNGQTDEIQFCMDCLEKTVGTDLKCISEIVQKRQESTQVLEGVDFMTTYYLRHIATLLYGEYCSDSCFYNTYQCTACLYPADMDEIKRVPADWALVMFDYHN